MAWSSMIDDIKKKKNLSEMLSTIMEPPNTQADNKV
jgi:hypothetical protein